MSVQSYISEVEKIYKSGKATEHSYRSALQKCLESILKGVEVTNEPRRTEFGAPDYIISRKDITVGWIEAKDIDKSLDKVEKGSKDDDQWKRYTDAQPNIILTDYLEFRFFTDGVKNETIRIGEVKNGKVIPLPENFSRLQTLLKDFSAYQGQTIKSSKKLAEMMAHKASLMRDVFFKVVSDKEANTLKSQFEAFKEVLMHDMDEAQFADIYAQTVAYGLFTARLHDKTLHDFSRGEALTLIPKTNPFLLKLFHYVAGADIDDRIVWIVDALCEVYRATDLGAILKNFGSTTGRNDPIIHFYETFLAEYDPKLREVRGVYYTPEPVVQFIVRAVDDVLKDHFGLKDGLSDTSMTTIEVTGQEVDNRTKTGRRIEEQQVHKVQILDVATGTGTFLAEVIKQIYANFEGQEGMWPDYVEKHLLPRMHGFELLVASYAMCHMKLDLLLKETGYDGLTSPKRLSVFLTNSLEEHHKDSHLPFANWLSTEANEASRIKRDMPIMVAIGNPPYSGHSENKGDWIMSLMDAYKKEPGGKIKLKERNPKWLNNDYVKFIRTGEYYIEKNGEGVLAYITDHSYLDSQTFRGMRWHLLNTFDDIYIVDLHGNAKKNEVTPKGDPDKNVFDITQGVSIIIAVKKAAASNKKLASLYHADLWGSRPAKHTALQSGKIQYSKLLPSAPDYYFIPRDNSMSKEYECYFPVNDLFVHGSMGVTTGKDKERVVFKRVDSEHICEYSYRPFDKRYIFYDVNNLARARESIMSNMFGNNYALITCKNNRDDRSTYFCSSLITDKSFVSSLDNAFVFPLYLYEKMGALEEKRPNLDRKIFDKIKKTVPKVTPEHLFDYIYAVLHSLTYRERYAELLKPKFPCIPYPKDKKTFEALTNLGGQIRELHLMESKTLDKPVTTYPIGGDHEVQKPRWEDTDKKVGLGKVWINETQYFDKVPKVAWEFYIGGYQPAQKWLKDRKGRNLTADDVKHWQKIIVAQLETDRLMKEIDKIDFLPKEKD